MATRRPARESASKRVSQVSVGLSDLRMPWVSGGAPVNIDAKQTGVTEGITAHASTDVGAWRATGSKASAYERARCAPIASVANTSAFVTVRRAAEWGRDAIGRSGNPEEVTYSARHRCHVKHASHHLGFRRKEQGVPAPGPTSPVAPKRANPYTRGMLGATGTYCGIYIFATADEQATLLDQPTTLLPQWRGRCPALSAVRCRS